MALLSLNSTPAERARRCVFAELFRSSDAVTDNMGTATGSPTISRGLTTDGTDDVVTYPIVNSVKTVCFWITLATTTEDVIQLSSTHSIEVVSGTLTATGVSSPTIYVNGIATSTITTARSHVMITTATAFNADAIQVGQDDSFGEFKIEELKMFSSVLDVNDALAYTNNDMYNYRNEAVLDLPMRAAQHDPTNKRTLDLSGNNNHATLGDGSTPTTYPTKLSNRGYSFDGVDYLIINSQPINPNADFTLFGCCQIDVSSTDGFFSLRDGSVDGVYMYYDPATTRLRLYYNTVEAFNVMGPSRFTFVATFDVDGNAALYVDGRLAGTSDISGQTIDLTTTSLFIGCLATADAPANKLEGAIYQFGSIQYLLSPIQVADLHLKMMRGMNEI